MKGLTGVVAPSQMSSPVRISITMMGVSHHFFLTLRKSHISPMRVGFFAVIAQGFGSGEYKCMGNLR